MERGHDGAAGEPVPPGGRRAARKERTRHAIMSAAAHVFAERGYGGAALEEIARVAEVSIGSVYAHFPGGKQALFLAALTAHTQQDLHEAGVAITSPDGPLPSGLGALLGRIADSRTQALLDAEAWLYAMRHDDELSAGLLAHYRRYQQAATRIVRENRSAVRSSFDDEETGLIASAVIEGLFRQRILSPESVPTSLFLRALEVVGGVTSPAPDRAPDERLPAAQAAGHPAAAHGG